MLKGPSGLGASAGTATSGKGKGAGGETRNSGRGANGNSRAGRGIGIRHHPFRREDVPYPRSYERGAIDL